MRISYEKALYMLDKNKEYHKDGIYGLEYQIDIHEVEKYTFNSFWNEFINSNNNVKYDTSEIKLIAKLAFEAGRTTFDSFDELLDYKPKL